MLESHRGIKIVLPELHIEVRIGLQGSWLDANKATTANADSWEKAVPNCNFQVKIIASSVSLE